MPTPPPSHLVAAAVALFAATFLAAASTVLTAPPGGPPADRHPVLAAKAIGAAEPADRAGDPAQPRAGPDQRYHWPLAPPHPVLGPFEPPASPYGPGHRGVDLGGTKGEPVRSVADGVVVFAGQLVDRGVVSVEHPNGLRTTYEPVAPVVRPGQRVAAGAVLGHLLPGHHGCSAVPACLHWGVRRGEEYLDPLALMSTGRVRLLPWKE